MPDYVLKNKSSKVGAFVLSLPEGSTDDDLKAALATTSPAAGRWTRRRTRQDVLPLEQPTVPASATPSKETK
jgi:hypothetical protein